MTIRIARLSFISYVANHSISVLLYVRQVKKKHFCFFLEIQDICSVPSQLVEILSLKNCQLLLQKFNEVNFRPKNKKKYLKINISPPRQDQMVEKTTRVGRIFFVFLI